MKNSTRTFALLTLSAALAACSSVPERNAALDQARSRYAAAQADPQVAKLAPDELKLAGEALRNADQARSAGGSPATVDHLAYLTTQRVAIAQETASSKAAQAVTAGAAAERDKLRLTQRTNEADLAQQQLAQSQQSNARKTSELAAADASAQRDQARVSDLESQLKDLNARKTDRGMVVTLGDVLFDTGQAKLLVGSRPNMAKLADLFKSNPQRRASIEGFTDSVGGAAANMDLSQRRAAAVMSALVDLGVPADRLTTKAFGADQPVASNGTAAGRQLNRRVEIVFAPEGGALSMQ